jgi:hypothetical protein
MEEFLGTLFSSNFMPHGSRAATSRHSAFIFRDEFHLPNERKTASVHTITGSERR